LSNACANSDSRKVGEGASANISDLR